MFICCGVNDRAAVVAPQGLNIVDLEDLMEDINVYCELERDTNLDYWKVRERGRGEEEKGRRVGEGERRGKGRGIRGTDVHAVNFRT